MKVSSERIIAEHIGQDAWLVMWADGTVKEFQSHAAAEKAIKKSQKVAADEMLITEIEWRS